jgi:hypothetical protein
MARPGQGSDKLVCKHHGAGGWQWVDFELLRTSRGYAVIAPCVLGDHYLAPDPAQPGRHVVGLEEHYWPSATDAINARAEWRRQVGQ